MKMYLRTLLVALLTLCQAGTAVADSPYIWNGQWAKNLNAKGSIQGTGQPLLYNGQKNYVGNNSGVNASTVGWGVSGASTITGTNNPSFLPGANIGWALSISNGGSAGYARYRFTVDASDYGRVLLIQFDQQTTGGYSAAGSMSLDMYCTSSSTYASGLTRQSLSTDSAGVTKIPGLTGTMRSTFSAASATPYCELRYTELVADTSILDVSLVYVGPQSSVQGATIGAWQSYTPTSTGIVTSFLNCIWRRVGDSIEIKGGFATNGTGSGTVSLTIPSGLTINSSALPASLTSSRNSLGWVQTFNQEVASQFDRDSLVIPISSTTFGFVRPGTSGNYSSIGTGVEFSFALFVPINEYVGSGTVNLAQNDIQYAYNTSTTTANDTTSFGYGPAGVAFQAFAPTGVTPVVKRVQLQYPLPAGSSPYVELFDGTNWVHGVDRLGGTTTVTSTSYGFRLVAVPGSTTQYDVDFYSAYDQGTGDAWSVLASGGWKWRVAGGLPNQTVGFAAYVPGQSSGLVPAVGLPGQSAGTAACTGCVGEYVSSSVSSGATIATSATGVTSITLQPGDWDVQGLVEINGTASLSSIFACITTSGSATTAGSIAGINRGYAYANGSTSMDPTVSIPPYRQLVTTPTVYYLNAQSIGANAVLSGASLSARRRD